MFYTSSEGKNLNFMMEYVRLCKIKPVQNCKNCKLWQVEHSDAEPASLLFERVYSCGILTGDAEGQWIAF